MDQDKRKEQDRPVSDEELAQTAGGAGVKIIWKCNKCGATFDKPGTCPCGGTLKPIADRG